LFTHQLSPGPWASFLSRRKRCHGASQRSADIASSCFMFSLTDAAKQVDVEFRPGIVAQAANPIRALSGAISGLIKT
jgi:hypothetical protein